VQLVRTVCEGMYDFAPRGDFRIVEAYRRALLSAQRLIYLENQFLWAPEIAEILIEKLRRPPTPEFRVVVLLPANPNNGSDDTQGQLGLIADADSEGRFLPTTIYARTGARSGPLYVHAKVGIVDDRWMTIGSANLNAHSLFNDSEVNVITDDAELARRTRVRLWAEHLERPERRSRATPPRSSTSCGGRRPRSSSPAGGPTACSRIGSCGSSLARSAHSGSSALSRVCSWTVSRGA